MSGVVRYRAALLTPVLLLALAMPLASCGAGRDDAAVDPEQATRTLTDQRTDVRAAAREVLAGAEQALAGRTAHAVARYEGCASTFDEEFRNVRYIAQAKVDVDAAAGGPDLGAVRTVLERAGFTVEGETPGPGGGTARSLVGSRGAVTAVFTHTGGAFLGLDVYGPCVDVPEGERSEWVHKREPHPDLAARDAG